jgi:hypothetical protein
MINHLTTILININSYLMELIYQINHNFKINSILSGKIAIYQTNFINFKDNNPLVLRIINPKGKIYKSNLLINLQKSEQVAKFVLVYNNKYKFLNRKNLIYSIK